MIEYTAIEQLARLFTTRTTPPRRTMIPNDAPIIQLLRPATDEAVMRAIHKSSPTKWHKAYGIADERCPFCHESEQQSELSKDIEERVAKVKAEEILDELAPDMEPWQRKLALEVLAAQTDEMDAVVAESGISPALQEYLDAHELVPDAPAVTPSEHSLATTGHEWKAVPRSKADRATDEQFVQVDTVVVGSYGEMTAKALRPLASAAGMKGARVASKADLVAYLTERS